jgi:3-hydroxyacyl-CoA dehydrogenase
MTIEIHNVTIAGAGTMGPGMAAIFASHGYDTTLTDIEPKALERAESTVDTVYAVLVKEGFMSQNAVDEGRKRLRFVDDLDAALRDVDFLVETVPE